MSERSLQDADRVELSDDDLFDDAYLGDEPLVEPRPNDASSEADPDQELEDLSPGPAAAELPLGASPAAYDRVDGVDALAEPESQPYAAGPAPAPKAGLRERIRSSRYGTLVVLLVTAALVAGGMWIVNGSKAGSSTLPNGATAVSIPGKSTVPPPKVGTPAQDFTVTGIDGKKLSLSQFKGKPVWIVFGASWCSGCQAEAPDIEAAYKEYGPKGLVILGINITEGTDAVRDYAQRVGLTFPMAADPDSAIADAYRVSAIPAHFFVDERGVLHEMRQGTVSPEIIATSLKGLMAP